MLPDAASPFWEDISCGEEGEIFEDDSHALALERTRQQLHVLRSSMVRMSERVEGRVSDGIGAVRRALWGRRCDDMTLNRALAGAEQCILHSGGSTTRASLRRIFDDVAETVRRSSRADEDTMRAALHAAERALQAASEAAVAARSCPACGVRHARGRGGDPRAVPGFFVNACGCIMCERCCPDSMNLDNRCLRCDGR